MEKQNVLKITKNTGRLFICGDIHGMFSLLESGLKKLGFDEQNDLIAAVGDLIDRGDESHRALEFINKNWFVSAYGNHEDLMVDAVLFPTFSNWRDWEGNGGVWPLNDIDIKDFATQLFALPIAIEISFFGKKIGVVHSSVPNYINDWSVFIQELERNNLMVVEKTIWERVRVYQTKKDKGEMIENIDLVVSGHTITEEPVFSSNSLFIDTGAFFTSEKWSRNKTEFNGLSIIELIIDDGGDLVYDLHTFYSAD